MVFSLATLPCGVGLLFIYWFPHVTLKLIAYKCSMTCATHVLLKVCTIALYKYVHKHLHKPMDFC